MNSMVRDTTVSVMPRSNLPAAGRAADQTFRKEIQQNRNRQRNASGIQKRVKRSRPQVVEPSQWTPSGLYTIGGAGRFMVATSMVSAFKRL